MPFRQSHDWALGHVPLYETCVAPTIRKMHLSWRESDRVLRVLRLGAIPAAHHYFWADREGRYVIVANQKAGSSTLIARLSQSGTEVESGDIRARDIWSGQLQGVKHFRLRGKSFEQRWKDAVWVTSIRNPYTRLYSCWSHLFAAPSGEILSFQPELARYSSRFEDLIEGLARMDSELIDPIPYWSTHWLPQTQILTKPIMDRCDVIVDVESMEALPLSIDAPWLNSRVLAREHAQRPLLRLADDLINVVREFFAADFAAFNYSTDFDQRFDRPLDS